MTKQKIFKACGIAVVLFIILAALGSSTPKTVDQFIKNYNNELKDAMTRHVDKQAVDSFVKKCSLNGYTKNFNGVNATFTGYEEPKLTLVFQFAESTSASEVFGMIDAAILAVGDDYKKVDESLGILNETNYNINGGYQKDITVNGKEYLIEWVEDSINFMIIILK